MGGALEGGWMEGGSLGAEEEGDGEKTRLVGENGRGSSADPFQWEEGSTGSRDSSVFQNSVDESSNSQERDRSLFTTPQTSPGGSVRKERLVIKFRRISEKYYMVEETNDSSCLNYKQIRHQFEEYDLSDLFETPKKNTTPKVTCFLVPLFHFTTFCISGPSLQDLSEGV